MKILKKWLLIFCLLLSSCSLIFPTYHRPKIKILKQWDFKGISLTTTNHLPYLAWWKKFHDPVLNGFIESALKCNNSIGQARGNIEQAVGELKAIKFSWLPTLGIYAGYSLNPMFAAPGRFYAAYPGYFALEAFQLLAKTKSYQINLEAKQYLLDSTKLVLVAQVANSYYTYLAQYQALVFVKRYIHHLQELLDIQNEDYRGGLTSLIVPQNTKEKLALLTSRQHLLERDMIKSQNALAYLMNQNPGSLPRGSHFFATNTYFASFATLPARVLANRPDVAYAEAQLRLAVQNVGVANSQFLPVAQLDYLYGHIELVRRQPYNNFAYFDDYYVKEIINPAIFGEIIAYKGARKTALYTYVDKVRLALREVADGIASHQKANQSYLNILTAYQAAKLKSVLYQASYQQGIVSYKKWLLSQLQVDELSLRLNQMKLMQMLAVIHLYQDLGGGYKAYHCLECLKKVKNT